MGRRYAHNDKFVDLDRNPCVYAVELANGIVKVGFSRAAKNRMFSLSREVVRRHGAVIQRFQIVPRESGFSAHQTEIRALAKLSEGFTPALGCTEYFTDLDFDVAVSVLREVCESA